MSLLKLPFPSIVEELDYEEIVQRKLNRVKQILKAKGVEYIESEADDLLTLIEMDSYEEMLLRASLNERIKQNFLAYATGSNLDHIGTTRFGVERLAGTKPTAKVEFSLSLAQDSSVVIPKGLLLGDEESIAELKESVEIEAGSLKAEGVVELDEYVSSSDAKLETILTPLPWVVEAKQITGFGGGAEVEDDERYRDRIWLSRERKTTAGSKNMYIYYAMSSDTRVKDVDVKNGGAGVVDVCYHSDEDITNKVQEYLSSDDIRPLTDSVVVSKAVIREVSISATLVAKDVSLVDMEVIKGRFREYEERFGVFLSVPKIYDLLSDKNIVDVELDSPAASITTNWNEVVKFNFELDVRGAE